MQAKQLITGDREKLNGNNRGTGIDFVFTQPETLATLRARTDKQKRVSFTSSLFHALCALWKKKLDVNARIGHRTRCHVSNQFRTWVNSQSDCLFSRPSRYRPRLKTRNWSKLFCPIWEENMCYGTQHRCKSPEFPFSCLLKWKNSLKSIKKCSEAKRQMTLLQAPPGRENAFFLFNSISSHSFAFQLKWKHQKEFRTEKSDMKDEQL